MAKLNVVRKLVRANVYAGIALVLSFFAFIGLNLATRGTVARAIVPEAHADTPYSQGYYYGQGYYQASYYGQGYYQASYYGQSMYESFYGGDWGCCADGDSGDGTC